MKKRITAFLLSLVLCLCCISCNRVPEVETVPVSSTDEANATTEAETDESTPADALRYTVISTGEFEGENAPLFAKTDGDRYIETLTQVKLLDYNSDGSPDWDNGIATIKMLSNEQEGTTTCTIALKDGVLFSDSSKMTVDDLIFTYYVAGDISYDGPYRDAVSILHGLSSYRVNNTGADMVTVTDEMVNASFTEDADVMLAISDQIVRPVLAGEKEWCEENWSSYSDRGYGKSPSDFFVSLYILPMDVNYDSSGKDFDRVIEDAVNLYGADYKSLGMYYRGNSTYFDNDARRIARRTLESKLYGQYGGEEIFSISGIERVDDRTLKLTFDSLIASEVEAALNLPVLSLNHCGNKGYNYEEEYFGVNRGDVSFVRTRSEDAFGAGRYILKTSENTQMIKLIRNERYYALDKESPKDIKLVHMGSSATKAALSVGTIDAGRFRINNAEDLASVTQRSADKDILVKTTGTGMLTYVGINSARVQAGNGQDTPESIALRTGLMTALSVNRQDSIKQTDCASLVSMLNTVAPLDAWYGPETSGEAYSKATDGTSLYEGLADPAMRPDKARGAVVDYLVAAGFTYDEAAQRFTAAPEQASLAFNIAVNPSMEFADTVNTMLSSGADLLSGLGITLNIIHPESQEAYEDYMMNNCALWVSTMELDKNPDVMGRFSHSSPDGSFFGEERAAIEENCSTFIRTFATDTAKEIYANLVNEMMGDAVILPLFEKLSGIGARTQVNYSPTKWMDVVSIPGLYGRVHDQQS